jgi:6-phosphogluconolactonase (cycloisomerase 2 family)
MCWKGMMVCHISCSGEFLMIVNRILMSVSVFQINSLQTKVLSRNPFFDHRGKKGKQLSPILE